MSRDYTLRVSDILHQIYIENHPEEAEDIGSIIGWEEGLEQINTEIEYGATKIFNFTYDYYGDEDDKKALEQHILKSYYTRNICCDSMIRWVLFLQDRMHDIMPKYKALFNAQVQLLASDILSPYHLDETKKTEMNKSTDVNNSSRTTSVTDSNNDSNSSNNTYTDGEDNTHSKEVNKFSNTPQAMSDAIDSGSEIPLNYLSTMGTNDTDTNNDYKNSSASSDSTKSNSHSTDNNDYNSNETGNETKAEDIIREIKGNLSRDNYGKLIKDYQGVILNIEQMISDELKDLFYMIY